MARQARLKRHALVRERGRGVKAAYPPFKRRGEGSTPSGPNAFLILD